MNRDTFWILIGRSREHFRSSRADGNMDGQEYALRDLLLALPAEEVAVFDDLMHTLIVEAYTWSLWGAAYLLNGGCSDDCFTDFRAWLVSMGRETYEDALADPDSLASAVADPTVEDFSFEEFASIPSQVYEEMTGNEAPERTTANLGEPRGEKFSETLEDLKQHYPKIAAALEARN